MREYLLTCGLLVLISLLLVPGQDTPCEVGLQCVRHSSCQSFIRDRDLLTSLDRKSPERARLLNKLKSLVCNKDERKVCCGVPPPPTPAPTPAPTQAVRFPFSPTPASTGPDSPSYLPSLEREECGVEGGKSAFVLRGENTTIGEFPFLGLLGKEKSGNNKWVFLSAGHCGPTVDYVRLGEWKVVDPETETECEKYPASCRGLSGEERDDCERCQSVALGLQASSPGSPPSAS